LANQNTVIPPSAADKSFSKAALDLAPIIEPVQEELKMVGEWLETNLIDDNPFISELLSQIFRAGGKRLRPAIVLLCSRASLVNGQEFSRLHIILAVLTELIHAASLVHDDVIDKASLRRGSETINRRFNDRMAVLMGDLLFAQASICLARIMNPVVVGIYGQVLGDLCAGEISQMRQQFSIAVDFDAYLKKSAAKTASLFAAGSHAGAILNRAPDHVTAALREYGYNLGLCFQIVDDLLDIVGTSAVLGKEPGSDLRSGILTAPALYILAHNDHQAELLKQLVKTREICSSTGSEEALKLIKENGGVEKTWSLANEYARLSKETLHNIPTSIYRDALESLVDYALTRVN
jgi:all-trans-nonaprenyl-diphosphate synthase